MPHSTQFPAIRKATPIKASDRSATNSANKTAERFAGHRLQDFPQMPRKFSRAERLAALDVLMSDFDRKAAWISVELHRSLNSKRWLNSWRVRTVPLAERAEFERIIAHLRSRDPVLRRSIGAIEWGKGVTVALDQGGGDRD